MGAARLHPVEHEYCSSNRTAAPSNPATTQGPLDRGGLRLADIDLEQRTLCIRGAKGGNDRVVALPACLVAEITQQMQVARAVWQHDSQDRIPLMLPHLLAKKYPEYQFTWGWAWLFPAHQPCRDPRSGTIVRFRMHEVNVQRAVKHARRKLGISVLPHEMRHAYATHCLQRGTNPRAIQKVMGHKCLETTMGYFHAEALSVASPLDALPIIMPPQNELPTSLTNRPAVAAEAKEPCGRGGVPGYVAPKTAVPSNGSRVNGNAKSVATHPVLLSRARHVSPSAVTQGRESQRSWVEPEKRRQPVSNGIPVARQSLQTLISGRQWNRIVSGNQQNRAKLRSRQFAPLKRCDLTCTNNDGGNGSTITLQPLSIAQAPAQPETRAMRRGIQG